MIQFTYDTLGRRLSKKVNNRVTKYIYSNQDVIEETLSTVNPTTQAQSKKETRNYTYGNKGIDDVVQMKVTKYKKVGQSYQILSTEKYFYEKDNLGSITKITSHTGATVEEYTYTSFGKPYKKNPTTNKYQAVNGQLSTIGNTRMYTGREYDREILLSYHRARYYDANLGRFTSRDPIGIQDDINLYTYTANSPMNYVDRMGKEKKFIYVLENVGLGNTVIGLLGLGVTGAGFIPGAQPLIPLGLTMMGTTTIVDVGLGFTKTATTGDLGPAFKATTIAGVSIFGGKYIAKGISGVNVNIGKSFKFYNPINGRFINSRLSKISVSIEQVGGTIISGGANYLFNY